MSGDPRVPVLPVGRVPGLRPPAAAVPGVAVALIVILMLPFNVGSLFVTVPEIGAATLSYLLLALTLERGPRVPRAVR